MQVRTLFFLFQNSPLCIFEKIKNCSMIKPLPALLAVHLSIPNYCFVAAPGFSCPSWHMFSLQYLSPIILLIFEGLAQMSSVFYLAFLNCAYPIRLGIYSFVHPWHPVGLLLCTQSALLCFSHVYFLLCSKAGTIF